VRQISCKATQIQQYLPDDEKPRPLVTFALFAYNQESYIREAVKGAFEQTYEPLEIILSDDCSSDRTFDIMQEMARGYQGAHRIVCSRNSENIGLVDHACKIAAISSGELIVLAAGDDISMPTRSSETVVAYQLGFDGIFSSCTLIDGKGDILQASWVPAGCARSRLPWMKRYSSDLFVYGASSAYSSQVFRRLPHAHRKIQSEDTPLNAILQATGGRIIHINKPLVHYRVHEQTLSTSVSSEVSWHDICIMEARAPERISRDREILLYIRNCVADDPELRSQLDLRYIDRMIDVNESKMNWYQAEGFNRVQASIRGMRCAPRWHLLRLFGSRAYLTLKKMSSRTLARQKKYKP
jgi:glycosyltransferase involved in cell wall biosynthesis